jgi:hypothetical protein
MSMIDSIESVELVDKLMICFRNGVKPADADIVLAYELGINVRYLKQYIEEIENDSSESEAY